MSYSLYIEDGMGLFISENPTPSDVGFTSLVHKMAKYEDENEAYEMCDRLASHAGIFASVVKTPN